VYNGLSLEQAPPISVVLRFFLSVPLFGLALSFLLILFPSEILTPLHPYSLTAVHLTFLGIITMSMIGALFQMQSVLGGRPIPAPAGNAFLIHLFLFLGTFSLAGAFIWIQPFLFTFASIFLGAAVVYLANLVLPLLFGGITHNTLRGMRLALISLTITAVFGIVMASSYANASFGPYHEIIRLSHYSLGLIGWIATLIIAVAFQVIEMFYVTPPYSPWCQRNAFTIILSALVMKLSFAFLGWGYLWIFDLIISALLLGFAVTTFKRLRIRKRRYSDVSIWFWNFSVTLLATGIGMYIGYLATGSASLISLSLISFALFALGIIFGMMGKIVPFLIWFHLSSAGYLDAPIMSNIIPPERSKALFYLFGSASFLLLCGVFVPSVFALGGVIAMGMFALLLLNLLQALRLYRHTLTHGTRFTQE